MITPKGKVSAKKQSVRNPYAHIDWEKATVLFQKQEKGENISRKYPAVRDVLRLLAAASGIGLIFAFPGAAPAIGTLFLGKQHFNRWQTKQIISQLEKQKYVEVEYLDQGKVRVKITKDGMVRALTYELEKMELVKPKRWDKKWRVVIFDIPEKHRRVRDVFRMRLTQLGLYQLQESVYVSPYTCFDEVAFLRELYGVAFTVRYLFVEKIEDDEYLHDRFNLDS